MLAALLPGLADPRVVATVGRHLQDKRIGRQQYDAVREAFKRWAASPGDNGWVLRDTLARMADNSRAEEFLELAVHREYGSSRAFIVDALWRFKATANVEPTLRELIRERDVSLYAMTALQRTIGAVAIVEVLQDLIDTCPDDQVVSHARRQLKRVEKKLRES